MVNAYKQENTMKNIKEIYNKMDKNEQGLIHRLGGILVTVIIILVIMGCTHLNNCLI